MDVFSQEQKTFDAFLSALADKLRVVSTANADKLPQPPEKPAGRRSAMRDEDPEEPEDEDSPEEEDDEDEPSPMVSRIRKAQRPKAPKRTMTKRAPKKKVAA